MNDERLPGWGPSSFLLGPVPAPMWAHKPTQAQGLCSPFGPERLQPTLQAMAKEQLHTHIRFSVPSNWQHGGHVGLVEDTRELGKLVLVLVLPLTGFRTLGTPRE